MIVEFVVEVVPCTLLGESQVGGEIVNAVAHYLLFLMQSSLCTEEVVLGDVVVRVLIFLNEEWILRSSWPIHHRKQICKWKKGRNYTKFTLSDVENGSMITQ